jgi:hypothetical protein
MFYFAFEMHEKALCKIIAEPYRMFYHLDNCLERERDRELELWCLTQYFSYIMAASFIGGGNQSTGRKPSTSHKSLTNFIK